MKTLIAHPGLLVLTLSIVVLALILMLFVLPRVLFPPQPELTDATYFDLFPHQQHYLDLDNGSRIHYVDEGEGPTLLLLHGNPTSAFLYRHLITALKPHYRVGGPVGRWINAAHNGVVHQFLKRGIAGSLDPVAYAAYFQPFLHGDRTAVTVFPRELITAAPFLRSLEKGMKDLAGYKALIVWGEKDFAFQEPERVRLEGYFPDHQTVLLPNAGHFLQEDSPQEIASAISKAFPSN